MFFSFKFFPFKDFLFSILPTVASFNGYLQELIPLPLIANKYVELVMGLLLSVCLAIIFHKGNVRNYKKSLAEILATGYFTNYVNRLGRLLDSKAPLRFSFPDQSELELPADSVKVIINQPISLAALKKCAEEVNTKTSVVYIRDANLSEPFWVRARKDENDRLLILEYPRSLFTLPKYLKKEFSGGRRAEEKSKKIFGFFNAKIDDFKETYAEDIPISKLEFRHI